MVPIDWFPDGIPFTDQFSAVFEEPLTVAVNCCEPPRRTLADAGTMETAIDMDDDGDELELLPRCVVPAQPSTAHAKVATTKNLHHRIVMDID